MFVLVHYFGAPNDGAGARAFCDGLGAVLVEDAAHALGPAAGIGDVGDAVCYSPYKLFAAPDGALMLVRPTALADRVSLRPAGSPPPAGSWLAKRLLQIGLPAALFRRRIQRSDIRFEADPAFAALPATPALSAVARRLFARFSTTMATVAAARRANADMLNGLIAGRADVRPVYPDTAAPYRAAWRFDDPGQAEAFFDAARAHGCPAESWPDLAPEVQADPATHAVAIRLRATVVTLPVHQTLKKDDLSGLCRSALS